jgi:hypothetical protein
MNRNIYRGIFFGVAPIGNRGWTWEINPPLSVLNIRGERGEIEGDARDAIAAARAAIDRQTTQYKR